MKHIYLWGLIILCASVLISLALVGDSRVRGQNSESSTVETSGAFFFQLELEGQSGVAEYTECSGLGSGNDVEESLSQTAQGTGVTKKMPGALEWRDITLKREGLSDEYVWSWRKAMEDGDFDRAIRNGGIIMFKTSPPELVARWDFRVGWAARLTFDGSVETLTIVHEGIERVEPRPVTPHR